MGARIEPGAERAAEPQARRRPFFLLRFRRRVWIWLGLSALAIAGFAEIAEDLKDDPDLLAFDERILAFFAGLRGPVLNSVAVDFTALGSAPNVILFSLIALLVFGLERDRLGSAQLVTAAGGSAFCSEIAKRAIERERPPLEGRVVEAFGWSFPSGHTLHAAAMYLTIAVLVCRGVPTWRGRALLVAAALFVIGVVGFSRVYLGVHYPSDVASGLLLGTAWAAVVEGAFSELRHRRRLVLASASVG